MTGLQEQILEQCLYMAPEGTSAEVRCVDDLPLDVVVNLEDHNDYEISMLNEDSELWDEIEIYIHNHYREQRRIKRYSNNNRKGGTDV